MDKDEIYKRWKPLIDAQNRTTTLSEEELEEWYKNNLSIPNTIDTSNPYQPLLPTAVKIAATTIGGGGWVKSKKQQLKESRLNKLRQLQGEEPNVVLPNDEYVEGLVSVKPLSDPIGQLLYIDYKYDNI